MDKVSDEGSSVHGTRIGSTFRTTTLLYSCLEGAESVRLLLRGVLSLKRAVEPILTLNTD